jgi:hypothetical protein
LNLGAVGEALIQNQYRNLFGEESLWLTHTVGDPDNPTTDPTGIRWYQLDVTGKSIEATPVSRVRSRTGDGLFLAAEAGRMASETWQRATVFQAQHLSRDSLWGRLVTGAANELSG